MSKSRLEPQLPSDLRSHLETILGCVKSLHTTLSAVMADVAAIRKTVLNDPANIELYQNHLKQTIATTKPLIDEAMISYDSLMREIVDSQQWEN